MTCMMWMLLLLLLLVVLVGRDGPQPQAWGAGHFQGLYDAPLELQDRPLHHH